MGTPSAPHSTPVKGSLENNPGIVLYHPPNESSLDKEQDEEIVVPLVFDDFDFSDGSSWLRSTDLHSSAFYPHEQVSSFLSCILIWLLFFTLLQLLLFDLLYAHQFMIAFYFARIWRS